MSAMSGTIQIGGPPRSEPKYELARRSGTGTQGFPITVRTNHFKLHLSAATIVYQYDVTIEQVRDNPPPSGRPARKMPASLTRAVIAQLVKAYSSSPQIQGSTLVYDGSKVIYASKRLNLGREQNHTFDLEITETDGSGKSRFSVRIQEVGQIDLQCLDDLIGNRRYVPISEWQAAAQAIDIIFHMSPASKYPAQGNSFFVPDGEMDLGGGVHVRRGYVQSLRPGINDMFINVDVAAMAFYPTGPLVEIICRFLNVRDPMELRRGIPPKIHSDLKKYLKGLVVTVTHRGGARGVRRSFKVLDLSRESPDEIKFKMTSSDNSEPERELTVTQYCRERYNVSLHFPFLPCVEVKRGAFLPPELCHVEPNQMYRRKLNETQTATMIKFTCQKPHDRAKAIEDGVRLISYRDNEYLEGFSIRVEPRMHQVKARQLKPPTVLYNDKGRERSISPRDGAWNMRDKKVLSPASIKSWGVLVLDNRRPNMGPISGFLRTLLESFKHTGLDQFMSRPPVHFANPSGNIERDMFELGQKVFKESGERPELFLVVLPTTAASLYNSIKRLAYIKFGVQTQCMQAKHLNRPNLQYCANLCLKINVKLGGINSTIPPEELSVLAAEPTLILGADVSHPGPGMGHRPSTASVVGSINRDASRYHAMLCQQPPRTEIIGKMGEIVLTMLRRYYSNTKEKPKRIVIYRDGVSEGQFQQVLDQELSAIKQACNTIETTYNPKVTFIVIQKRTHARFLPLGRNDADRSGNVKPGTIIDTDIINNQLNNFFMQSHAGIQGTSRPSHYYVLYDDNNFSPDDIQQLTYNLCYTYAICTRSVSIVTPAYYAHRVAARATAHTTEWDLETEASSSVAEGSVSKFDDYKLLPVHERINGSMYFM